MSKKDLIERLSRAQDGRTVVRRSADTEAAPAAAPARPAAQNTRVSGRVVRRRRKAAPAVEAPQETPVEPVVVVEEPPAPEPEEVIAAPEEAPVAPPPVEVEATPEVEAAPAEVEVAVDAAPAEPEPAVEEPVKAEPEAAPAEESKPQFAGLGKAVVMPPPGYDPTNPQAYRGQQERQRAELNQAQAAKPAGEQRRGRRRVEPQGDTRRPASGPAKRRRQPNPRFDQQRFRPKRRRRSSGPKAASPQPKAIKRKVRVHNEITVSDLAAQLGIKATGVIKQLMGMGMMVTVNETLDFDTATLVASEFDYTTENVGFQEENFLQHVDVAEEESHLESRPPVITVMGHVDHGKTTLLDAIRDTSVASGEAGGITQHVGAYQVEKGDAVMTFIDTPGHAAFSAMRARGAEVTDIVVLVVAADDGVQPQTVEAINHSKAAGVPIIVAVNKMDKPDVNADNIKQRLSEFELIPEEWGGETLFVEISALKHMGIDDLLETIALQAEMLDLVANSERHADGVVLEAQMVRGKGPVATVLIQSGTLKRGDHVVIGAAYGRIRAMNDWAGVKMDQAGPSVPGAVRLVVLTRCW